jgi:hypothetical protein
VRHLAFTVRGHSTRRGHVESRPADDDDGGFETDGEAVAGMVRSHGPNLDHAPSLGTNLMTGTARPTARYPSGDPVADRPMNRAKMRAATGCRRA